jgi:hypothetical protein
VELKEAESKTVSIRTRTGSEAGCGRRACQQTRSPTLIKTQQVEPDGMQERNQDLSVIPELVKRLETTLLPVPGTEALLSKTEFTVGEWKLYLKAEGLPYWQSPGKGRIRTDEHPVVFVSWNQAVQMCDTTYMKFSG